MRSTALAACCVLLTVGCGQRTVDVDPLIDPCADAPPRIVIDDDRCDADAIDRGACIDGDAEFALDEDSTFDVEVVTGSLVVHGETFDLFLPSLRAVGGCVVVDGDLLRTLDLSGLAEASRVVLSGGLQSVALETLRRGDVVVEGTQLTDLSLAAHRDGSVELHQTRALRSLLSNTLAGSVIVDGAEQLSAIALPELRDASELSLGRSALTAVTLPSLEQVGRLIVVNNTQLRRLQAPELNSIETVLRLFDNALIDADVCTLVEAAGSGADVELNVDLVCPASP